MQTTDEVRLSRNGTRRSGLIRTAAMYGLGLVAGIGTVVGALAFLFRRILS